MVDINGREVTVNAGPRVLGLGTHPFSITRETRAGRVRWVATWHPTWHSARFASKRDATAFIKAHERAYYGRSS